MFKLTLTNNDEDCEVYFDTLDTNIAKKWVNEINKDCVINEGERFSNFPNTNKDLIYFVNLLNGLIDIVNNYKANSIPIKLTPDMNQDTMNYLHKFFEDLRGPILATSEFYNNSPTNVQQALMDFNLIIHEFEHFQFNEKYLPLTNHPYATIVCTYNNGQRYKLEDDDYQHYTFKWEFGTIYINYCEVGKPLLDVFKDNDDIVGDDNIRPLTYYSCDWQLKLGPSTTDAVYTERLRQFKEWFDANQHRLNLEWGPKLALGMIPVAKLNYSKSNFLNKSEVEIIELLSKFNRVKHTCIK